MNAPVVTFFNNRSGVGKTSLTFHLAWMFSELGERVLACDLDPQARLTASFLDDDCFERLWENESSVRTVYRCVKSLTGVGDLCEPEIQHIADRLWLIPGDIGLSTFERDLAEEWPNALGKRNLYRTFRILTAFWQIMQEGAGALDATIVLVDVGPNLGALNRSALVATDYVIAPFGADLFSLRGLQNLGPTLANWRRGWSKRRENWDEPGFPLPRGSMKAAGYVVRQHDIRLGRPIEAYDKWVNKIPEAYAKSLLGLEHGPFPATPGDDSHCLATFKHYRSLVPMAQEARKPVFSLTAADGAIGSHAAAVTSAHRDFEALAKSLRSRIGVGA